ncbi:MAG: GIY-YIG nuclease family protein [Aequorivita sp.]
MATVYILHSKSIDGYYTGSCLDFSERYEQHLNKTYGDAYTKKASDWILYFRIEALDYEQARKIEKHIKSMKSRKYIENLKKYPEMVSSLIEKYFAGSSR